MFAGALLITQLFGGEAMTIYDIEVKTIDGKTTTMADYKGKVLLIVNVASRCGYTNQYEGLQALQNEYRERGLAVLGFPCNQFLGQEPGNEEEIKNFCSTHFGVTFDMFAKIDVNGEKTHPLYRYLKTNAPGVLGSEAIKWNFTKFLVDRNGQIVKRYAPSSQPEAIAAEIETLL